MLFQCEDLNELVYGFLTKDEVNYVLNKLQLILDIKLFAVEHGIVSLLKTGHIESRLLEKAIDCCQLKVLKILVQRLNMLFAITI